jgi:sugar lactone lactonase YvrE
MVSVRSEGLVTMPQVPNQVAVRLLAAGAVISLAACAGSPPVGRGGTGAGGSSGVAGAAGAGGSTGTAGSTGAGGSTDDAGSAGNSDSDDGGDGGDSGAGGGATDAPLASDGSGPHKQFSCPPGPFPAQVVGASTPICTGGGFTYNYTFNEGPTWIASQNAFFFSNFIQGNGGANKMAGDIIKYPLGGTCEIWLHDVGCNGLGVSAEGQLLAACHGPRAVMEYDVVTKQGRVVATMAGGQMLDSPNDLIAHSNGTIYFSNAIFELGGRPQGLGTALVKIDLLGNTSVVQMGGLNGVALSPDEKKLYVVQMGVWDLDDNGNILQKTNAVAPVGDGIAVDCAGAISNNGTNSAFGGPDGKTLLVVGGGTAARTVQMTVPGIP